MHRHIVALLVMLIVVVLVIMHYLTWQYDHRVGKTTAVKKLGVEKGISVWEAERRLDAMLFLYEIPKWEPGGPHHLFLFQKMFTHAKAIGLKEYHWQICQGHWKSSPERDLQAKASTMEMLTLETTCEEVLTLY